MKHSKKKQLPWNLKKKNSARDFQQLNDHITMVSKTRDSVRLDYEKEMDRLRYLQQQRIKQEDIVKQFENNNEGYAKIKKTVEEKVRSVLSDRRMVLKLALLSLTESMKNDPDKYSRLIYNNTSSSSKTPSTEYSGQYYETSNTYGQQQQQYPSQAYTDMILDEAEKLYNKLTKELGDEIISNYASSTSSSSLPLVPQFEERQSDPTTPANQIHMHTEEHRFTQSEIDDDN